MLSLRDFMFERVYLGAATRAEHRRAHETSSAGSSTTSSRAATRRDDAVDYVAGMTDRFALAVRRALDG